MQIGIRIEVFTGDSKNRVFAGCNESEFTDCVREQRDKITLNDDGQTQVKISTCAGLCDCTKSPYSQGKWLSDFESSNVYFRGTLRNQSRSVADTLHWAPTGSRFERINMSTTRILFKDLLTYANYVCKQAKHNFKLNNLAYKVDENWWWVGALIDFVRRSVQCFSK